MHKYKKDCCCVDCCASRQLQESADDFYFHGLEPNEISQSEMKPTHGGPRKNSGRKPKADKRITRSISLPPATWEKLDAMAKRKGVSRSECVNRLVEWIGE